MATKATCVHERRPLNRGPVIVPKGSWCYTCESANGKTNWGPARSLTTEEILALEEEHFPSAMVVCEAVNVTFDVTDEDLENLRRIVEQEFVKAHDKIEFKNLGPVRMRKMSVEEWAEYESAQCNRYYGHSGPCNGRQRFGCGLDFYQPSEFVSSSERTSGMHRRFLRREPAPITLNPNGDSIRGQVAPFDNLSLGVSNQTPAISQFAILFGDDVEDFGKFQQLKKLNAELVVARREKKRARKNKEHWQAAENTQRSIAERTSEERYRLINELGVGDDGFQNDFE